MLLIKIGKQSNVRNENKLTYSLTRRGFLRAGIGCEKRFSIMITHFTRELRRTSTNLLEKKTVLASKIRKNKNKMFSMRQAWRPMKENFATFNCRKLYAVTYAFLPFPSVSIVFHNFMGNNQKLALIN